MDFPTYLHVFGVKLHPHAIFESLGMFIGFRYYLKSRRKEKIPEAKALFIFLGAIFGAFLGAILLATLEHLLQVQKVIEENGWQGLIQGKTIVGGLLGGLIGVESVKKMVDHTESTGDDMVIPLALGIAIGRIGCFLTGIGDETVGIQTTWSVGIDFGDGMLRHPTQLYEIGYLFILMICCIWLSRHKPWEGFVFQIFMLAYLNFRFLVEWLKPTDKLYVHLSAIQWACILGVCYYVVLVMKKRKGERRHAK